MDWKTGKLVLVVFCLLAGCSSPPPGAVPGRISIVADTDSPFWKTIVRDNLPDRINDAARYKIIDGRPNNPYKLHIEIYKTDRRLAGINNYGSARYQNLLEVKATLTGPAGSQIWRWEGWAESKSSEKSMEMIGEMIGEQMKKDGLLEPSYYAQ